MSVLYIRELGGVVERVRDAARELRARHPEVRVSDADVARQLLQAALQTPTILRRLGMNGRGSRASEAR